MDNNNYVHWNNRWIFILAATGSAVGLGNIWKFPYITGENGGGAFVLVYLACIFALGIPVMMAEVMLGRAGRANPVQSMLKMTQQSKTSRFWVVIGAMGVITGLMILSFYSVIAGWAVEYVVSSAQGSFAGQNADAISGQFTQLLGDKSRLTLTHTVFMIITGAVVGLGVTDGLGNAVRILMPLLFVLLLVLIGYSITQGDAASAAHFMFDSDFSKLTGTSVLIALGHAFFTLSLAMGAIMVYGSYMPENAVISKTVLTVAVLDTLIALGAGMAIFPLVFANELQPGSGPGLLFVTLPIAFGKMTGGVFFGTTFFVLVTIAALSSAISILEPGVAWLQGRRISRTRSTIALTFVVWLGGLGCIFSNNWLEDKPLDGTYFFETIDHIASNIMLPLGGLLIAIFVGWVMRQEEVKKAIRLDSEAVYTCWIWSLRVVAPTGIVLVFAHTLGWI
jgi:neurotransmitter:Na+ symporter, NSS family